MRNQTIFQAFHWYYSAEGNLWLHIKDQAKHLSSLGFTHVWLPPAYKSADGINEPGYAVYDLYDLGEFDQKGTIRTRYGTKEEYIECIEELHKHGIEVLADTILNHRLGADERETVPTAIVNEENRNEALSDVHDVEVFTRFTFPGRKGQYSDFEWNWHCFTGVNEDGNLRIILHEYSKGEWEEVVEDEFGNYDYLMGNDIEFRNPHVREELQKWGEWFIETTGIDGFRLDALKHITPGYLPVWLDHMKKKIGREYLCIGEYWKDDAAILSHYIDLTEAKIQLFDVPLHGRLYEASKLEAGYDLRTIFDNTLIREKPHLTITFVDNHDTQPLQALESYIEFWFKPLAYALILLREQGIPCVFYPDLFEAKYTDEKEGEKIDIELHPTPTIENLLKIRANAAYGMQRDYFDNEHVIGWTREGAEDMPNSGIAVIMSNFEDAIIRMGMGERNAGKTFYDQTGNRKEKITLDDRGEGDFPTYGRSVSVWVNEALQIK